MDLVKETMRALAFLSRLPVSTRWFDGHDGTLSENVRAFPLAGMIIALPASLALLVAAALHLPDIITAILVVITTIVTTGALHEDGLADVADGFYGGSSKERRLEIMKDSSIGSYGTLALIISVLLRTTLLATMLDAVSPMQAVLVVIATEAASRAALARFWQSLPSARAGGVSDKAGIPDEDGSNFALVLGAILLAIGYGLAGGLWAIVLAAGLTAFAHYAFVALCRDKIGGQTGDTLGAMQQIATISLLLGLVIAL